MIRVLIVDDHPVVRRGLTEILSAEPGISVAAEAENGAAALSVLERAPVDVVLLDVTMPGRSGLEVLAEIRRLYPKLPVLVLSVYPEEQIGVRAIRSGASGYINKDTAPDQLITAIQSVVSGRRYVTPGLAVALAETVALASDRPPHETLSDREFEVFRLISSGKSVSEIAGKLNLSVKTVSTYRTRILEKMNMRTNADLTRYAIVNKLAD